MWYAVIMIEVRYILHLLGKNGKRIDTPCPVRKCIVEKQDTIFEQWAYLKGSTEIEILSTREVTEQEVATSKATADRIAKDYRPDVYNGD